MVPPLCQKVTDIFVDYLRTMVRSLCLWAGDFGGRKQQVWAQEFFLVDDDTWKPTGIWDVSVSFLNSLLESVSNTLSISQGPWPRQNCKLQQWSKVVRQEKGDGKGGRIWAVGLQVWPGFQTVSWYTLVSFVTAIQLIISLSFKSTYPCTSPPLDWTFIMSTCPSTHILYMHIRDTG